jgi:hypothetical protein
LIRRMPVWMSTPIGAGTGVGWQCQAWALTKEALAV